MVSQTIIFIRDINAKGQEVSGYIDYANRLRADDTMEAVFNGKRRLLPRQNDLRYMRACVHMCACAYALCVHT